MTDLKVIEGGGATVVNLAAVRPQTKARKTFRDYVRETQSQKRCKINDAIEEQRDRIEELFVRYKQAEGEYKRLLTDVARKAGLPVLNVAAILRAARKRDPKPFEPEDWCSLM